MWAEAFAKHAPRLKLSVLNISAIVGGSHSVLIGADVLDELLRGAGCVITSADASAAAKREAGARLMRRLP